MVTFARREASHWIPGQGNCWVSICPAGGDMMGSWVTMNGCARSPGWTRPHRRRLLPPCPRNAVVSASTAEPPVSGRGAHSCRSRSSGPGSGCGPSWAPRRGKPRPETTQKARRTAGHPRLVWPRRSARPRDRLRHRDFHNRDGEIRAARRRHRRRGLPARAGATALRHRPGTRHQYPADPRRRRRRAGFAAGSGLVRVVCGCSSPTRGRKPVTTNADCCNRPTSR